MWNSLAVRLFEFIWTFVSRTGASAKTRRSSTTASLQQDPLHRRRLGSELSPSSTLRRVPTEHDEAIMLEAADLEDMASMSPCLVQHVLYM